VTLSDSSLVRPDATQARIIEAAPTARQLVLAGPGTGKTFVLIERLKHLVATGIPGGTIVVLSYTRAAVREIRERLRADVTAKLAHPDVRLAHIRTFDSMASVLLRAAGGDLESTSTYDDRIELFTDTVRNGKDGVAHRLRGYFQRVGHLIVDEIQDLVGVRARMVMALLNCCPYGFTLLGDPNQAIYDYQTEEQGHPTSREFLAWLGEQRWNPELSEVRLERNYRQDASLQRLSARLVAVVASNDDNDDGRRAFDAALELVKELPLVDVPGSRRKTRSPDTASLFGERSCILCRTNGEVLDVMAVLARNGIPFHYQAGAEERALPAWIGRVLGGYTSPTIDEETFIQTFAEKVGDVYDISGSTAWEVLKRVEQGDGNFIRLERLKQNLLWAFPDELCAHEQARTGVCVSTIHKAKGREFEHVHLLVSNGVHPEASFHEEARVVYVAVTRARAAVDRLKHTQGIILKQEQGAGKEDGGRWLALRYGKVYAYEIGQPGDIDSLGPVNLYLFSDGQTVSETQEYIWQEVNVGDPVLVTKYQRGWHVFYRILHKDQAGKWHLLGQMSQAFRASVYAQLGRHPWRFKYTYVVAKTTEVCQGWPEGRYDQRYLKSGLWMNIRLRGLGIVDF